MPPALLVSLALTLGGTLIGAGIAWGVLRTRQDVLAENDRLRDAWLRGPLADWMRSIGERIASLEESVRQNRSE